MPEVDDYFSTLSPSQRQEFERISKLVMEILPAAQQGRSYAMPAFMYQGKGLLSVIANKKFLSLYPFSGKVIEALHDRLKDFECTTGSIHFSVEHPIPEEVLREIITTRLQEIEAK